MSSRFSGPRAPQGAHLGARLDLEDAGRVGVLDALVRRGVVVRDPAEVDPLAAARGDVVDAALDRRQHPQAEQVDLQKARVGAGVLVPLGELAALHRRRHERDAVHERARRDDHPARVLGEMARQAVGLVGELDEPLPAPGPPPGPEREVDVAVDLERRPALAAARDALDLARRQPQRLADLADRAARAVRRKGGDERRALRPVALVHARDELLAHVAREVEVDVRQRGELLVEEAPEQELVGDRVDVAEPGEVADDRGDARTAAAAGWQQRAGIAGSAHLHGDLSRELEQVAVQQEEAGQAEAVDDAQLLLQARLGLLVMRAAARVALVEARLADLGQRAARGAILRAGIAVAEVAREVEGQRRGEAPRLGDGVGVVGEAGRHRLRGGEHVRVVAAPQRLGGVERRVLADRHEGVLQVGAVARVRVDVAGGDRRDAEPLGEPRQPAVERAVVARQRALQLDAEGVAAEGSQQAAHRRLVAHAAARAAAEADEAGGVLGDVVQRDGGLGAVALRSVTRVRMGAGQQPAEVAPTGRVADEQREMALVVQRDLRPVDRPQPQRLRRLRELHRPRQRVVVGQRQRPVPPADRRRDELLGLGGAVEEGVRGVRVQLGVGGGRHTNRCSHTRRMA